VKWRFVGLATRCACLGALILRVNTSRAQTDEPVELVWEAPENCPQQLEVEQQVRSLVGTSSGERMNPLRVHGAIEPLGERYRLTLFIERSATRGTRVIESDDCNSLGKAAAVVLGLLVQKERTLGRELSDSEINGQPDRPPKPPGEVEHLPPKKQPTPPVLQPTPRPPRPWHVLLRIPDASLDFNTLPRLGYGMGVGVGMSYYAWRAILAGAIYPMQDQTLSGLQLYRAEYRRRSLEASVCHGWRSNVVEVAPCAVLAGDAVSARASGEHLSSHDQTARWISVGGGISGFLHLGRYVSLVASGTGRFTTNRTQFLVNQTSELAGLDLGLEVAHRVPLVTLSASLACEWIF
jgi:hypothetical protein